MEATDRQRFVNIMATLGLAFAKELEPALFEIYFRALSDLPIQDVSAGSEACLKECEYFPRVADIRQRAYRGEGQAERHSRVALPPHVDYESGKEAAHRAKALIESVQIKRVPRVVLDADGNEGTPTPQPWVMSEDNWQARWDLVRLAPDLRVLLDAIPPALRVKFAAQDHRPELP